MRNIIFPLIIIVLITAAGCSVGTISNYAQKEINSPDNLIHNSGFELSDDGLDQPEGWVIMQDEEFYLCTQDEMNSGYTCLKIEESTSKTSIISEAFPIDPAGVYLSRCFIRTEQSDHAPVELHLITFDDEGNKLNVYTETLNPSCKWEEIRLTSGFFPQKATKARIAIVVPESGSLLVDDVESYKMHRFAFSQK